MMENFFSVRYEGRGDLFEGLSIWKNEKFYIRETIKQKEKMTDALASMSLHRLARYLSKHYGKNVIILLDEYDTPMQEAYIHGYWEELVAFIHNLFNSTFKTNPYLERAIMTGITRVSKESKREDTLLWIRF